MWHPRVSCTFEVTTCWCLVVAVIAVNIAAVSVEMGEDVAASQEALSHNCRKRKNKIDSQVTEISNMKQELG